MRVVGGRLRGRALKSPPPRAPRPTTDRLREALFNVLAHAYGDAADGARVLDLFAGTGALGIEAVSRGASFALFVEEAVEARALIRENVEALGLTGSTRIFRRDATRLAPAPPARPIPSSSAIRPMARAWLKPRCFPPARGAGSRPRRWWWWKKRPAPSRRRTVHGAGTAPL